MRGSNIDVTGVQFTKESSRDYIWLLKSTIPTQKNTFLETLGVCFALMFFSLHDSKLVSCSSESELRGESVLQFPPNVILIVGERESWEGNFITNYKTKIDRDSNDTFSILTDLALSLGKMRPLCLITRKRTLEEVAMLQNKQVASIKRGNSWGKRWYFICEMLKRIWNLKSMEGTACLGERALISLLAFPMMFVVWQLGCNSQAINGLLLLNIAGGAENQHLCFCVCVGKKS